MIDVNAMNDIFTDIRRERKRQQHLKDVGKFKFAFSDTNGYSSAEKAVILLEEVGEIAEHIATEVEGRDPINKREMKKELIQVAALAVAWCESLTREIEEDEPVSLRPTPSSDSPSAYDDITSTSSMAPISFPPVEKTETRLTSLEHDESKESMWIHFDNSPLSSNR
jgi:NTP pyrophosphatase (non-canonical NTP hydrolase)